MEERRKGGKGEEGKDWDKEGRYEEQDKERNIITMFFVSK